ncbi:MAG: MotA/TolQ/ExbB proton channel family protein [Planctomycetia bacterium]|nr:MotA/TolQ/ExbB proton channel family protein [Planctomycetia bacterium]
MSNPNRIIPIIAKSPILWGCLASAGFYTIYHLSPLKQISYIDSYMVMCFTGHPIEYTTTTMFFIGLAALVFKALDLTGQSPRPGASNLLLGPIPRGGQPVSACESLLARLNELSGLRQNRPLVHRLREMLERVRRCNSAEGLDEELKYLADRDADRLYESYALFRVVIWAIPILGFLGTVVGIAMAIANLKPNAIEESLPAMIAALSVAFGTTNQSLTLSIILMFGKFVVGLGETRLMTQVDRRTDDELLGRFEVVSSGPDGQLAAVRRMSETLLQASEELVRRQAELWQESIQASERRWVRMGESAEKQLETALAGALTQGLKLHAENLAKTEQAAAAQNHKHWDQVQRALVQGAEATAAIQEAVNQQAGVLCRTVEATGQVAKLEETLNRNLATLAGSKHFEQTVMSLAAAIHLLNARLGESPIGIATVHLESKKKQPGQAA